MKTPGAYIALLTVITLLLVLFAIHRSARKLQTVLYIVAAILVCGIVGAVIGLASVNAKTADILAWLSMEAGGIAAIQFIALRQRPKTLQTAFYIVTIVLACGLAGTVFRLASVNSHAAGTLTALFMLAGGIAVSIEQIRKYRMLA